MHTSIKRKILLALAVLLLAASGVFHSPIHDMRSEYDLTSDPVQGVSPELVLATTALGGFRGVIVDVIWIRLQQLKQQGRFFEIVQLSDWACKLAPRFPKIWQFHAWNMAYNVSVELTNLEERWSWVNSGLELLRDEAIPLNPQNPELYNALARIYLNKIGEQSDDAHAFYKFELGLEMHEVLDGQGTKEKLGKLAEMPDSQQAMLENQTIKKIYDECKPHEFNPLNYRDFFTWLNNPDSIKEPVAEVLENSDNEKALKKIENFARAQRLKKQYRLQPQKMIDIVDRYGPFDWRSPYPHAIYWATRAKEVLEEYKEYITERRREFNITPADLPADISKRPEGKYREIDYDRTIYASMQALIQHGRLTYNRNGRLLPIFAPDYRFTEPMIELYEKMTSKYSETIFGQHVKTAYMHFLRRVSIESYLMGDEQGSVKYWNRLKKEWNQLQETDPKVTRRIQATNPWPTFENPYSQAIEKQVEAYIGDMGRSEAGTLVRGLLTRAYIYYGANVNDKAQALEAKAKALVNRWNQTAETLRWTIQLDKVRETVLIDIFSNRISLPEDVMDQLKTHLGEERVKKYQDAVKDLEKRRPVPEDIPDRFKTVPGDEE